MSDVQDYMMHQFLIKNNGRAKRQEIIDALRQSEEAKQIVKEKKLIVRFGIVSTD